MADSTFLKALLSAKNGGFWNAFFSGQKARQAGMALDSALISANQGTSFPTSPTTYDRFFRTDRGVWYFYDGTRWLSVEEYVMPCSSIGSNPGWTGLAATNTTCYIATAPNAVGGTQIYITKWDIVWWVTAPNVGADDWTISLQDMAGGAVDSFSTDGLGEDQWVYSSEELNSVRTVATDKTYRIGATKVGSPGNIFLANPAIHYRLVG